MVRQLITVVLQDFSHQFDFIVRLLPFDPDQDQTRRQLLLQESKFSKIRY